MSQKTARANAEMNIYKIMDMLENTTNGFNAAQYKMLFSKMSDKAFDDFMTRLANDENYNLYFEADLHDAKHTPDLARIKAVAEKMKIPLTEYVALPYKRPEDPEHPPITATKVPVIYVTIRPLQQMVDKKQAMASDNDSTNVLTGQVTGKSKAATFSNMQTIALTTSNQLTAVKELLGPRADDNVSKEKMIEQIETTGQFDINTIPVRTEDKRSIDTVRVMLIGAGFRVSFGNHKASYILKQ